MASDLKERLRYGRFWFRWVEWKALRSVKSLQCCAELLHDNVHSVNVPMVNPECDFSWLKSLHARMGKRHCHYLHAEHAACTEPYIFRCVALQLWVRSATATCSVDA